MTSAWTSAAATGEGGPQTLVAVGGVVALEGVGVLVAESRRHDRRTAALRRLDEARRPRIGRSAQRPGTHRVRRAPRRLATSTARQSAGDVVRGGRRSGGTVGGDALAHGRQRPVRRDLGVEVAGGEVVDQRVELVHRHAVTVAIVDLQARRLRACRLALGVVQGERAVGRRATGLDPEALLGVVHQRFGAQQCARHRAADVDQVLAHRLELEHLVERPRAVDLGGSDAGELGDVHHGVGGDVAVLLLGEVQQRDQRRLRPRVATDDLPGEHRVLDGQPAHAAPLRRFEHESSPHRSDGLRAIRSTSRTGSTRDDRHGVGDEATAHHVRQRLDVDERRRPHVHPVRSGRTVAGDVATELAARALDGDVDLAGGHLEPLGEQLEVVDQRLHRLVDARPRRRRDLLVLDPVVAGRHGVEDLTDDAHRLTHLVDADGVTVEGVAE